MSRKGTVWQDSRAKDAPAIRGAPWYFVVDIAAPGTPRRQVKRRGFPTRDKAQQALDEVLTSVRGGSYVEVTTVTVEAYMARWLDGLVAKGRRPTTIEGYQEKVRNHIAGTDIAAVPLQALTTADLNRHYAELSTTGRKRTPGGLSPRSVRYVHSILSKALNDAEREGLIRRNPATLASPPSTSAARAPEMTVWTPAELAAFLRHVADRHHGRAFHVAAMTGLRRGELCGLRWSDVALDTGVVTVRQTVTAPGYRVTVGPVKTSRSRRAIDVDAGTVSVLRAQRTAQLEERMLMGGGYTDQGFVFAMPDGRPWHPDTITQAFDRLVGTSGLPRIRLHDLRHTHASHALAAGVNAKVVSERLGHSSVSFTLDTYGHVLPGQQSAAAAAVAALVAGS